MLLLLSTEDFLAKRGDHKTGWWSILRYALARTVNKGRRFINPVLASARIGYQLQGKRRQNYMELEAKQSNNSQMKGLTDLKDIYRSVGQVLVQIDELGIEQYSSKDDHRWRLQLASDH